MHPYRTRFKQEIVAEFLPPRRLIPGKPQRAVIFCEGMPGYPRRGDLLEFFSKKGYWAFSPRYRGSWESGGIFLAKSPHLDTLDIISELQSAKNIREAAFGKKFPFTPGDFFVIGGSFGGPAALLASLDPRVKKVVANCPVVDWAILRKEEEKETSNPSYVAYIKEAFGNGYRLPKKNWEKLYGAKFYNPAARAAEFDPRKAIMFHAKDDPYIPWRSVDKFARKTGITLHLLGRGGHLSTQKVVVAHWSQIKKHFFSK